MAIWPTVRLEGAEIEDGNNFQKTEPSSPSYVGNGGALGPTIFLSGTTFSARPVLSPCFIAGKLSMLQAFLYAQ